MNTYARESRENFNKASQANNDGFGEAARTHFLAEATSPERHRPESAVCPGAPVRRPPFSRSWQPLVAPMLPLERPDAFEQRAARAFEQCEAAPRPSASSTVTATSPGHPQAQNRDVLLHRQLLGHAIALVSVVPCHGFAVANKKIGLETFQFSSSPKSKIHTVLAELGVEPCVDPLDSIGFRSWFRKIFHLQNTCYFKRVLAHPELRFSMSYGLAKTRFTFYMGPSYFYGLIMLQMPSLEVLNAVCGSLIINGKSFDWKKECAWVGPVLSSTTPDTRASIVEKMCKFVKQAVGSPRFDMAKVDDIVVEPIVVEPHPAPVLPVATVPDPKRHRGNAPAGSTNIEADEEPEELEVVVANMGRIQGPSFQGGKSYKDKEPDRAALANHASFLDAGFVGNFLDDFGTTTLRHAKSAIDAQAAREAKNAESSSNDDENVDSGYDSSASSGSLGSITSTSTFSSLDFFSLKTEMNLGSIARKLGSNTVEYKNFCGAVGADLGLSYLTKLTARSKIAPSVCGLFVMLPWPEDMATEAESSWHIPQGKQDW